jgi:hypothetical protein
MKRIYYLLLICLCFSTSAYGYLYASRNNTEYYYNGSNYIYDDGTICLNGNTPADGDSLTSCGWAQTAAIGSGTFNYNNTVSNETSGLSLSLQAISGGTYTYRALDTLNKTFNGTIHWKVYINTTNLSACGTTADGAAGIQIINGSGDQIETLYISRFATSVYCGFGCAQTVECGAGNRWLEFWHNFSQSGRVVTWFNNGTQTYKLSNVSSNGGIARLQFIHHNDAGNFYKIFIDDFWMCNGDCPMNFGPGPSGIINITYGLNISTIEFAPNWTKHYSSVNFTSPSTLAGNFTINFTEYNISIKDLTTFVYNVSETNGTNATLKASIDFTQSWFDVYLTSGNTRWNLTTTQTNVPIIANQSSLFNITLDLKNASQTYVNWSLSINKAYWNFTVILNTT